MQIDICKRYSHVLEDDRLVLNEAQKVTLANTGMDQQVQSDREPAWDDLLVTALRKVAELLPRFAGEEMLERFRGLQVRRDDVAEAETVQRQIQKVAEEMEGVKAQKEGLIGSCQSRKRWVYTCLADLDRASLERPLLLSSRGERRSTVLAI
ncbi:hypothetical protein EJ03DRAFT_348218 [Teratosphaeria nubilosa]|uniref:Uncharacterized protein n=1 Tax=Teratosphaeria nubilosa TaxID=161662 RepID=A0A6G1LJY1_9PEZI|nr:hypothetical protein EJ03DRAFT_348218 [Teratosphaeria nubilosa]